MAAPSSRFDPSILRNDPGRASLLGAMEAALDAVEPARLVSSALGKLDSVSGPATVIALGKAGPAMARGAADVLAAVRVGLIVSDHEEEGPPGFELMIGGHPLPDRRSVAAATRAMELLADAPDGTPVVFLVSGGGSALFELPAPGVTVEELSEANRLMLAASLPITVVNAVRARLSAVKGGGLGAAASHLLPTTLILSDVGRAGAGIVASGPTTPPTQAALDLEDVLREHQVWQRLTAAVRSRIASRTAAATPPPHPVITVGDGFMAAGAAMLEAGQLGWVGGIADEELAGEAADAGRALQAAPAQPGLTIWWGECTVDLGAAFGSGGRNQEGALAAAIRGDGDGDWVMATLATDGIDGNTTAAGAIVDGRTSARIRGAGMDPAEKLAAHDSHTALAAAGDVLCTGPTGTNVADLWMLFRRPAKG